MNKASLVCTLYEGEYHFGVAALINSLYTNGYTQDFYVGYRGDLPPWAAGAQPAEDLHWPGAKMVEIVKGSLIYFLPVQTDLHLTNYKPAFLLKLQAYIDFGLFYFDPDIVVKCKWEFFEEWIKCGVAVVQEIVMNSCSPTHPRRIRWQPVIKKCGRTIERNLHHYFNGGFCGIKKNDIDFINAWQEATIVGIQYFDFDPLYFSNGVTQTNVIPTGDQDALNIAAMCCKPVISDYGPEAMDFVHGGWLMSHATGSPKPWKVKFIQRAMNGYATGLAEKNYWSYVNTHIITHPKLLFIFKKISIKIASMISRFYSRK